MGFFGDLLGAATKFIPGPVDDILVDAGRKLLGGNGNGNGGARGPRAGQAGGGGRGISFFTPPLTPQQVPGAPPRSGTGARRGTTIDVNPPFAGPPGIGIGFGTQTRVGVGERSNGARRGRGQAVPMLGHQGVQPAVENRPTRQCPTGMVLAKDGLCYDKRLVTKRFRMWPPAKKPPISVSEMNALRAAKRVEKKVKRLGRKITPEGRKTLKLEE